MQIKNIYFFKLYNFFHNIIHRMQINPKKKTKLRAKGQYLYQSFKSNSKTIKLKRSHKIGVKLVHSAPSLDVNNNNKSECVSLPLYLGKSFSLPMSVREGSVLREKSVWGTKRAVT